MNLQFNWVGRHPVKGLKKRNEIKHSVCLKFWVLIKISLGFQSCFFLLHKILYFYGIFFICLKQKVKVDMYEWDDIII